MQYEILTVDIDPSTNIRPDRNFKQNDDVVIFGNEENMNIQAVGIQKR
jgi:hypothetical protein